MTLPNSTEAFPSGGASATHTPAGLSEFQVVMLAGSDGHLHGTRETWQLWVPPSATAASKMWFDLFNAVGSGKIIEVLGLWALPTGAVVTGTYHVPNGVYRTSAIGTGGTAASTGNVNPAAGGLTPKDTANAALPAGITARIIPTAGATKAAFLVNAYIPTEESNAGTPLAQYFNLLPDRANREQNLVLREGQGLLVQEDATATPIGSIAWLVEFAVR